MNPWDIIWPENSETATLDEASVEDQTQYDSYIPQDEPVASLAEPTQDAWDQTQWVDPSLSSTSYTDLPSPEPSTYQSNVELDNPIPAPDVVYPEDNYTVSTPESEPVPELLNSDLGVEANTLVQYEEPQTQQALMSVDVPQEQINIPDVISGLDETNYALSPTGLGKAVGDAALAAYKEDAPIAEKGIDTAIGAIGNVASNVSKIAAKFSSDATSELETQDTYGVINYLNQIGYDETTAIGQTARDLANPNKPVVGKIGSVAVTAIDALFGEPARQVEKIIGVERSYVPRVVEDESIPQFGKYSNSFGAIGELLSIPAKLPKFVADDIIAKIEGQAPKEQRVLSDEIAAMIAYADSQGYQSSYYEKDKATGNFGSLGAKLGIELGKSFSALLTGNESAKLYQENYKKTEWAIAQTSSSAYSSYEAQVAIAKRIAFGENPIIAKQGIQEPDKNALLVDKESWAAHVYNRIEVAGRIAEYEGKKKNLTSESIEANINAAKKEEAEKIARNKSIEGDENIAAEMLGQMILDPLNLVGGLGLFDDVIKRGTGQKLAQNLLKAEREFGPLAKDAEIIASKEVIIGQALTGMPETFVRSLQNLKEENAALRQAAKPSVVKELLEDSFDAVEAVIGHPPSVQASIKADHATSLLIQLALPHNADNASEVVSYISQIVSKNEQLWKDTKTISDVFGEALPKSAKMEIAKEVMNVAYTDLVKAALESQTADGFSRQKFLNESFDILQQAAKTTVPGAIQAETKFQQSRELAAATVRGAKAMLSKVFLNNPGSVLRNTGGDVFGIAIDDLIRESGGMKTADYLSHYGGSERVVSGAMDAIRAKYSFADELKSGGKGVIHNLTSAIMEKGSEWEQARYQHAFVAAHEQFMRTELKYAISDGIRAGVPEDMIQKILARASESSLSPKSIADEIRAMGKGKYTPPAIHELSGMTVEEIRKTIDAGDIDDIRKTYNAAVNSGKSKKDIIDDLDKLVESRKTRTSVVAANNGISNTPVTNRVANAATDVNHDISQVVSVARTSGADPSEASKLATAIKTQRDVAEKGFSDVMAQAKNKDIAPKVFSAMLDEETHHYDEYYKAQLLAHETAINKASLAGNNKAAKAAAWKEYYSASESAAQKLSLNIQSVHQTYSDAIRVGDLSSIPTPKNSFIDAYVSLLDEIESLNKQGLPSDSLRISLLSGRATFLEGKSNLVDVASKAVSEINNDEFTFRAFSHIKNAEVDSAKIFEKAAGQRTIVNSQVNNFHITIEEGEKLKAQIWQTAMRDSQDRILAAKEAIKAELRLAGDWQAQLRRLGYSEERIKAYEQGAKYGTTVIDINTILRDKIHAAQSPVAGTTKKISTLEQRKEINRLAISRGNAVTERNGTTVMNEKRVLNSLNANREPFTNEFKSLEEAYGLRYDEAVKALSSERSAFAQADYLNRQLPTLSKEIDKLRELLKSGKTTEDIIAGKVKHYEEVLAEVKRLDNLAANLPPMTTDEFERQLAMSFRLTKEETNASIAIIKARAESKGISYSDYVAERFASVRKTDQQGLVSSLERTGVPSLEIKYPDGKISVISEASIPEKELNLLKSTPGVEIISHPNGVFEYDGLIEPRLLYQYAGEKATLTKEQSQNLAKARIMFKEGRDPEEIRYATGWFLGPDKKVRYEIPDIEARVKYNNLPEKLNKKGFKTTLGEIYDHEELYKAYPSLRNREIKFYPPKDGLMGRNDDKSITIFTISPRGKGPDGAAWQSTLVHEIQHTIQRIEGFSSGGSTSAMQGYIDNLLAEYDMASEKALKKIGVSYKDYLGGSLSVSEKELAEEIIKKDKEIKRLDKRIAEYERKSGGDPYRAYYLLAGEIEARDVSKRILFGADRRFDIPPYSIENVPFKKMFVLGVDSGVDEARTVARGAVTFNPEDGKAIIYALKQPTVETFAHEVGHVFRRELTDAQLEVAGKWVGVGKSKVWNTANEEKFANGFVEYLKLGNAPTPELKNVFEKFKEWITNIWKNLSGEALPENMKALYSELLTPATKTAEGIIPGPIAKVNSSINPILIPATKTAEGIIPGPIAKVNSSINPKIADIRMRNAEELLRKNPENPLAISEYLAAEKNLKLSNATTRVNDLNDEILKLELKIRENPMRQHPDLVAEQQKLQKEIDSILAEYPEGIPILQNASNSSANTFIKQNISASVNGVGDPPMKHEIDSAKSKAFEDLVAKIKNNIETRIDIPSPEIANWNKTSNRIINHLQAQWNELNAKAIADATARADFSLLDYSKQRGFDAFIQVIAPYSFWSTRQARNYAVRLLKDPEILMHWLRFKDFEEKLNEQRGTNKSLQGKYNLNELSGGTIKGGYADSLYFAPLSGIVPLGDIFITNTYEPSRERSSMQMIYDTASILGVSPNPFIDTVVRGTGALVRTTDSQGNPLSKEDIEKESANYGGESLGYYWPFGSALSGITAAAGMNNGAGLNIERSMLKALGVQPRLQELKLISAGISSYSFENQKNQNYDPRYGVLAQAIHEKNKDSYAKIDDLMYGNTFEMSKRLAGEMQVSRKDAEIALTIYREGVARAAKERGVSRLFTWSTGMSSRYLSEGTKMQGEEQKDEFGAAYNKATKTGSRVAIESVRDKNPANVVARAQFATYPGDKKDPIDQWEWMEKQRIITSFGVIKDEFIKKNPADRKGAKAIDSAMWKEWAKIGADSTEELTAVTSWEKKINEIKGQLNNKTKLSESTSATIVYAPKSIYGASPDEVIEIRKGEILKSYKDKRPSPDNFIDSEGDVNYAAYKSAMESWSTNVKDKIMADKTTSAVLGQAFKDGNGTYENLNKWLAGNLDEDLKKYKARYDSPIEAAQELWFTKIYSKAFDDYGLLKSSDKKAYDKTVGSIPEMSDADLIKLVKANNFGMWKDSVIEEQIKGMKMPSGKDVSRLSMSKDNAEIEAAFKLFTETLSGKIPVGRVYDNLMKSNPLIAGVNAAFYNSDLRKKVTPEMIAQAQIMVAGYASANRITPNPAEWAEAKKLVDNRNKDMATKYGDKWKDTIDKYFELTAKERADQVKKDSVLAGMLKDYSSLKDNPLYKKYYAVDSTQNASGSSLGSPSGGIPSQGKSQVDRKTQALFWDSYGKLSSSDKSSLMKSDPMLARIINSETRLSVQPEMWSYYTQLMNGDINKEELSKLVKGSQTDKQARSVFWDEYLKTNNQVKRVAFGLPQVMKIIDDKTRDSATKEEFQAAYEILKEANNNYAGRKSTAPNVASPPQAKSQQPSTEVKTNPIKVSQPPRAVPVTRKPIVEPAVISKDNSLPQAFQKMYKSIPPSTLSQMVKDRPVIEKAKESGDINDLAMAIAAMEKWVPSQNKTKTLPPKAAPSIKQPFGTPAKSSGGGKKPILGRRPPRGKRGANTNTKVISPYKGK